MKRPSPYQLEVDFQRMAELHQRISEGSELAQYELVELEDKIRKEQEVEEAQKKKTG